MARRQSDIACDLVAIAKWPKEYFANQYGGKLGANTPEFDQFLDLLRFGMRCAFADAMAIRSIPIVLII